LKDTHNNLEVSNSFQYLKRKNLNWMTNNKDLRENTCLV